MNLDWHQMDSRIKVKDSEIVQTIPSNAGTGGNNTPMVMACDLMNSKVDEINNTLSAGANHNTHSNNVCLQNVNVERAE